MRARRLDGSTAGRLIAAALLTLATGCGPGRVAPAGEQSVVIISIDGFRADYLDEMHPPHLTALAARGVRARWLQPSTPTLTFPNHYTIVTGLTPAHHGIVNNHIKDPADGAWFHYTDSMAVRQSRWWGGEPLWVTAERQGVRSGAFFWVGTEATIGGRWPTFWKKYDDTFPGVARSDTILAWLTRNDSLRVRLALLYFSAVDHMAHDSGPGAPETRAAIMGVDSAIGRLVGGIDAAGLSDRVNIIVVSDHGMAPTNRERVVVLDDYVEPAMFDVVSVSPFLAVGARNGNVRAALAALRRVPHLTVYPRDSVPARWRYTGNPRIPPIVGTADEGWVLGTREYFARRPPRAHGGDHGYEADAVSMRALFVAAGPAFKQGRVVEPFTNVHIYDLACAILGLTPAPNDGSPDSTRSLLR